MQVATPRIASGPAAIRAAKAVQDAIQGRRDAWPFPHIYSPETSERRDPMGFCAIPSAAAQATVLSFSVPSGFVFYLSQIGLFFSGTNFNFGDFIFTIDLNTPLGAPNTISVPLTDWQSIPFPIGSFEHGPVTLPRFELFSPEDIIRVKVTNVNLGGGGGSFGAWLGGYIVPASQVPYAE